MNVYPGIAADNATYEAGKDIRTVSLRHVFVHPCVINNQPHIVYPRGLQDSAPALFAQLHAHYSAQGYALKEDQRTTTQNPQQTSERRRWAPVVLFAAAMLFESNAYAQDAGTTQGVDLTEQRQVEVHLMANTMQANDTADHFQPRIDISAHEERGESANEPAGMLYAILNRHYQQQEGDPGFVRDDLRLLADYYSGYPEVVLIFRSLANKNWTLRFDEHVWKTVANGDRLTVEHATVHFNTRSAAQLLLHNRCDQNPVCVASPADALLHELLHVYSMLMNSDEFIAQGGMSSVMYPFRHEYAVIDAERELYASMSNRDERKRPQRNEHTGRAVKASCPTCIK